jgi:hypothetical protein
MRSFVIKAEASRSRVASAFRIGRRTIFAMLLIVAVVAIWALLGGR